MNSMNNKCAGRSIGSVPAVFGKHEPGGWVVPGCVYVTDKPMYHHYDANLDENDLRARLAVCKHCGCVYVEASRELHQSVV